MTNETTRETRAISRSIALVLAVPAGVMLWSFHPNDCRLLFNASQEACLAGNETHNYMGELGSTLAYAAFSTFGVAAWLLWALCAWLLWNVNGIRYPDASKMFHLEWRVLLRGCIGLVLFLLFVPVLLDLALTGSQFAHGAGGYVGKVVFSLLAYDLALSASGAGLMAFLFLCTGITMLWNFLGHLLVEESLLRAIWRRIAAFLVRTLRLQAVIDWCKKYLFFYKQEESSALNAASPAARRAKTPEKPQNPAGFAGANQSRAEPPTAASPFTRAAQQQPQASDPASSFPLGGSENPAAKQSLAASIAPQVQPSNEASGTESAAAVTPSPANPRPRTAPKARQVKKKIDWGTLLDSEDTEENKGIDDHTLDSMADLLVNTLADFRHNVKVEAVHRGPVVSQFEISLERGTRVARIVDIAPDIARGLQAGGAQVESIRVVTSIPSSAGVGIEIPNPGRATIYLSSVLKSKEFKESKMELPLSLGVDTLGKPVVVNLASMPHLLVAGTTGSGKSVGINTMLLSLLYKLTPEQVRFILIDPKRIELASYSNLPHLITPVITDMSDAANALDWCVREMDRRYQIMQKYAVRTIRAFNELPDGQRDEPKLPFIVVIADEFADMILETGGKVETSIARLAAKARAAGIHLVLATQRPSKDVVTGLISANIPTRASYRVSSAIESRIILGQNGAEQLLGQGDMLFLGPGQQHSMRIHSAFVSDSEVKRVTDALAVDKPQHDASITSSPSSGDVNGDDEIDAIYERVAEFVRVSQQTSVSGIQRQFKVGYNRAARIISQLERRGVVSAPDSSGARRITGN